MDLFIRNSGSVKFKVMGTLGLTLIIFILGYFVFIRILEKKNVVIQNIQKQEFTQSVKAVLQTRNDSYGKMVFDYSVFSWMIDFIKHPGKKKGEQTITHPQNLGIDFIQIYNVNKKLIYSDLVPTISDTIAIPGEVLDTLYRIRKDSFFLTTKYGLMQVFGSTVHPSEDSNRLTIPNGFIFFGKLWDSEYLDMLKRVTNSNISLCLDNDQPQTHSNETGGIFLSDFKNDQIARINLSKTNLFMENMQKLNIYFNFFFIGFCLVLFIIIYFSFNALVISPLRKIEAALNHGNTNSIEKHKKRSDEFGKIALLIESFFKQHDELNVKIDELKVAQRSMHILNKQLSKQKEKFKDQNTVLQHLNNEMQAQNEEIVSTADGLQLANKEITDSINYASFIQKAVLVPSGELSRIFPEHFIVYKPKNIVSGDFYWFKEMKNGERILAVADCTGHGLSGSLLSMLGISFLNQIMSQLDGKEYNAASILDSLKSFFIYSLHQGGEVDYVQDGMHIALCIFDKDCKNMQYATAFHTICLVRKNAETNEPEMTEYKGNRIPVGIYITDEQFANYTVELKKDDLIYMFSDGYPDQFGGPYDKKYLPTRTRNLLLSISQKPLMHQKEIVIDEFENWKGAVEQTDDVIVMGIKVP